MPGYNPDETDGGHMITQGMGKETSRPRDQEIAKGRGIRKLRNTVSRNGDGSGQSDCPVMEERKNASRMTRALDKEDPDDIRNKEQTLQIKTENQDKPITLCQSTRYKL